MTEMLSDGTFLETKVKREPQKRSAPPKIRVDVDDRTGKITGLPPVHLLAHCKPVQDALDELNRARDGRHGAFRERAALVKSRAEAQAQDLEAMTAALRSGKSVDITKATETADKRLAAAQRKLDAFDGLVRERLVALRGALQDNADEMFETAAGASQKLRDRFDELLGEAQALIPQVQENRAYLKWLAAGGGRYRSGAASVLLFGEEQSVYQALDDLMDFSLTPAELADVRAEQRGQPKPSERELVVREARDLDPAPLGDVLIESAGHARA